MEKMELARLVNDRHPLVKLARQIDWRTLDEHFGANYSEGTGRPAISTRLMVSLHYLKYTHDLSDEAVLRGWVENPYWQYLSGMRFFEHESSIDPSSMRRWRRRVVLVYCPSCSSPCTLGGSCLRDHTFEQCLPLFGDGLYRVDQGHPFAYFLDGLHHFKLPYLCGSALLGIFGVIIPLCLESARPVRAGA